MKANTMAQTRNTASVGNRQSFLLVNIFFFYFPRKVCGKYAIRANVHILLLIILLVKMGSSSTFFFCFITQFLAGIFMKINVLCYINILYCRVGGTAVVLGKGCYRRDFSVSWFYTSREQHVSSLPQKEPRVFFKEADLKFLSYESHGSLQK